MRRQQRVSIKDGVLFAMCYADTFHFALTFEEIHTWFPFQHVSLERIQKACKELVKNRVLYFDVPYYVLKKHSTGAYQREFMKRVYQKKIKKAFYAAHLLQYIPTVSLVLLTGSMAIQNAKASDDIDFCIISHKGTTWTTRLLSTLLLTVAGVRRLPHTTHFKDTICLNMFLGEDKMKMPVSERDIYTGHEILQSRVLFDRDSMYDTFLQKNAWVAHVFPNAWKKIERRSNLGIHTKKYSLVAQLVVLVCQITEPLWYFIQRGYMIAHTREVLERSRIKFHPVDAREWITRELKQKLTKYHVPLDKILNRF